RHSTTDVNGLELIGIGSGVGLLYGVFGAGGSAFATPLLALAGVPPIIAVASPLPATIPAGLAGAWHYRRQGAVATKLARRAVLGMRTASGTSMLVAASLTVPTLATHWALGHVDWAIAVTFGLGLVPGTILGSRVVHRLPTAAAQRGFGAALLVFGAWYLWRL